MLVTPTGEVARGVLREGVARAVMWGLRHSGDAGALLLDPGISADPYPYYARIREQGPLVASRLGCFTARHGVAERVLRDPRFGHSRRLEPRGPIAGVLVARQDPELVDPIGGESMIGTDPPDHTRLRGLVSKVFTPRAIQRLRPRIERIAHDLLDRSAATGSFDLMTDYAGVLPVLAICEVLGVPGADREQFKRWGTDVAVTLDLTVSAAAHRRSAASLRALQAYFARLFDERRRQPGDDLISELLAVEEHGDTLTARELMATCLLLLLAGFETTVNLLGNGGLALLRHPDQLRLLRDEPDRIPGAVEEMLRYDSPVQMDSRLALTDVEIDGWQIGAGTVVVTILGGANRDPAVFADPDRFDVTRLNARRHLAFAAGPHHCLGAALARLEGEVAFSALLARTGQLDIAAAPRRRRTLVLRGLDSLPLRAGTETPATAPR